MYQGHLPMLTKGPFSIFYGGDQIIQDLSKKSPGIGTTLLVVVSAIFQFLLYIFKIIKSRKLQEYPQILKRAMVENVLNMYSLMSLMILSILSISYGLLHHWDIEMHKVFPQRPSRIVPRTIVVFFIVILVSVACPFMKSFALRYVNLEK